MTVRPFMARLAVCVACVCVSASGAHSQAFTTLHTFGPPISSLIGPDMDLVAGPDGAYYGTTSGTQDTPGRLYRATRQGTVTILHIFSNSAGGSPGGPLVLSPDGQLYGVTTGYAPIMGGGTAYPVRSPAVVYKITTSGRYTVVHRFQPGEGLDPEGPLALGPDGEFYGVCATSTTGGGLIYRLAHSGRLTVIHAFDAMGIHGDLPLPLVTGSDGWMYGVTNIGGANLLGVAFRINTSGVFQQLCSFPSYFVNTDGPFTQLAQGPGGLFYGIAGYNPGYIYSVSPTGTLTILHKFTTAEGLDSFVHLTLSGSSIYGVTTGDTFSDPGCVFRLNADNSLKILHVISPAEGVYTLAGLTSDGRGGFFDVSPGGGIWGLGTMWRTSTTGDFDVVRSFENRNPLGSSPAGGVIETPGDGVRLAVGQGGTGLSGALLGSDASGNLTPAVEFASSSYPPSGPPYLAPDGAFYGTAVPVDSYGSLYRIGPNGVYTVLQKFWYSQNNPVMAPNGLIYGEDFNDVVSLAPGGALTVRYPPAGHQAAFAPAGGLALGRDGYLYGVGGNGGSSGDGVIFRMSLAGAVTILHNFNGADGITTGDGIVQGLDGAFYGTAGQGGLYGDGVVYRVTANGDFRVLHNFTALEGIGGAGPFLSGSDGTLLAATDGSLYGAATAGGAYGGGTVYRVDADGNFRVLHSFASGLDGQSPEAPLGELAGDIYGVTATGLTGADDAYGTLFRIDTNLADHDFHGTGHADLLFQNISTGDCATWTMNGAVRTGGSVVASGLAPGWLLAGSADLNLDGHPDLLFFNPATGALVYWLMNGTTRISSGVLGTVAPVWKPICVADLDGTRIPYLLWQNSENGSIVWWHLNGTTVTATGTLVASMPTNERVVASADLNGDGDADLIFQDALTGSVTYWLMNGTTRSSSGVLAADVSASWSVAGFADVNGNFHPNLLWQNRATGQLVCWYLNGVTVTSKAVIGAVTPNWQLIER